MDWVRRDRLMLAGWGLGQVYVSRDAGGTVTPLGTAPAEPARSSRADPAFVYIGFVDDRRGFAGTCQHGMWSTRDGGKTWQLEASPNHGVSTIWTCPTGGTIAASDFDHAVGMYHGGLLARRLVFPGG